MLRVPSKRDPFRILSSDLLLLMRGFSPKVPERPEPETIWITPEPRLQPIAMAYVPAVDSGTPALDVVLRDALATQPRLPGATSDEALALLKFVFSVAASFENLLSGVGGGKKAAPPGGKLTSGEQDVLDRSATYTPTLPSDLRWADESTYELAGFPTSRPSWFGGGGLGLFFDYVGLAHEWEIVSCNAVIWYPLHRRNDMLGTTAVELTNKDPLHLQYTPAKPVSVQLDFGHEAAGFLPPPVQGGDLLVEWRNRTVPFAPVIHQRRLRVRGKNPKRQEVQDYIALCAGNPEDAFECMLIAYHESGFQQFWDEDTPQHFLDVYVKWLNDYHYAYGETDVIGLPKVGRDSATSFKGGFGIMQITNHPDPSSADIWDWKANVASGVEKHLANKALAVAELNALYEHYRRSYPNENVKKFQKDQIRRQAWEKYNGGNKRYYGWWDVRTHAWQRRPGQEGKREPDAQSYADRLDALAYVIEVLKLCPSPATSQLLRKGFPTKQLGSEPLGQDMPYEWCDDPGACRCQGP